MNPAVQIAAAFFGSLGFALLFGLRRRYLLPASLGGMLSWGLYLLLDHLLSSPFLACFAASAFSTVYAELLARLMHSPTTLFVIPAVIPEEHTFKTFESCVSFLNERNAQFEGSKK